MILLKSFLGRCRQELTKAIPPECHAGRGAPDKQGVLGFLLKSWLWIAQQTE